MKKLLTIAATVFFTAFIPFILLYLASLDYTPLTFSDEDFYMQQSLPAPPPVGELPDLADDAPNGYDMSSIPQEPQASGGEVYTSTIRDIINSPSYRDTYDPDMMVKKPASGVLSSILSAPVAEGAADDGLVSAGNDTGTVGASSSNIVRMPTVIPEDIQAPVPAQPSNQAQLPVQTQPVQQPSAATPVLAPGAANPLTGEAFDAAWNPWNGNLNIYRPWAVSIGNTADAMPLWGIGSADILVEFVVESFATRFLAIYQDISGAGRIGGIRSLRTSSMEIAASFDAVFAHWGGRTYDNVVTNGSPITAYGTVDVSSLGSRDPSKIAPNNAIVNSGAELISRLPASFRLSQCDIFKHGLNFTDVGMPQGGGHADTVTVSFSDRTTKKTTFSYDFYQGKYFVSQFGTDLIDGNDNRKLSFTNVLIIQTDMQFDCNESGHTFIRTTGTGTGYFVNGRKYTSITWSRSNLSSPYSYYLADGTPLKLGVGKTYICMVSNNQTPLFS